MKKFKSSITSTFIFTFTFFLVAIIPAYCLLLFLINPFDYRKLLFVLPGCLYIYAIVLIIAFIVEFLSSIFKRNIVTLDDEKISYYQNIAYYKDVEFVELSILSSRSDTSYCSSLKLYNDVDLLLEIINPSIWMILNIKRKCCFAKFKISNWFNIIIWMTLFIIIVLCLYIIGIR